MSIADVLTGNRTWHVETGDALNVLRGMPDGCVATCVTSPPYWALRTYGTNPQVWGGDPDCEHEWVDGTYQRRSNDSGSEDRKQGSNPGSLHRDKPVNNAFCSKCGAWGGELGLEPTPELYVEHLVEVFREVRRVLREDGTLWLNLGDSYASQPSWGRGDSSTLDGRTQDQVRGPRRELQQLKPKDLVGIPWRVAFALQADGWWLRSDIVWAKPNPLPESVTDRPTRAHEFIFLLAKSGTTQYWVHPFKRGIRTQPEPDYRWRHKPSGEVYDYPPPVKNQKLFRKLWRRYNLWNGRDYFYNQEAIREPAGPFKPCGPNSRADNDRDPRHGTRKQDALGKNTYTGFNDRWRNRPVVGRNKRTVWTVATKPFPEAHFAVYPPDLIEPCILAGAAEKACPKCGAPWERIVKKKRSAESGSGRSGNPPTGKHGPGLQGHGEIKDVRLGPIVISKTVGWQPTCTCEGNDGSGRSIVLDPFAGAGTTGLVATRKGRAFIGIELNPAAPEPPVGGELRWPPIRNGAPPSRDRTRARVSARSSWLPGASRSWTAGRSSMPCSRSVVRTYSSGAVALGERWGRRGMANPQPDDAHLRIAHSIHEQIMMRDFSKRQRSILDLVLRLSWGCGKKLATIPLLKDFELAGIGQNHVKKELLWLERALVISWDRQTNQFAFNKDYDQWRVSIVRGYDEDRLAKLVHLNIRTSRNGNQSGIRTTSQNRKQPPETGSPDFPKQEVAEGSNPDRACPAGVSKASIKESTTAAAKSCARARERESPTAEDPDPVFARFEARAPTILGHNMGVQDYPWLTKALARASPEQLDEAFDIAAERDREITSLKYLGPILDDIIERDQAREEARNAYTEQVAGKDGWAHGPPRGRARTPPESDQKRDYLTGVLGRRSSSEVSDSDDECPAANGR